MTSSVWNPGSLKPNYSLQDIILWALQYAILAPSAHNTQPWKWAIKGSILEVLRDPEFTLKDSDPTLRETFLGLGAFIENFLIAITSQGYQVKCEIEVFVTTDPVVAKITITEDKQPIPQQSKELFDAITKRHTNRGHYKPVLENNGIIQTLEGLSDGLDDVKPFIFTDQQTKKKIAELVAKGYFIALSMPVMKRELSHLIFSEAKSADTGMIIESMTQEENAPANPAEWLLSGLDVKQEANGNREKFATAPIIIVIGSKFDGPEAWVEAGRLLERILLKATSLGLNHDISAAAVEIPTLASLLRNEIDSEYRPQALFRLGIPKDPSFTKHSTRRPVKF